MSDAAVATDVGGSSPAEDNSTATQPPEAGATSKTAKPRTEDDDYNDFLKSKPLKYKAGGKEKTITSASDLKRLLSRVDGTESAASAALKNAQEAKALKEHLASISKLDTRERLAALQAVGVDVDSLRDAWAQSVLEEDAQLKQQAQLSPEQRAFMAQKQAFEQQKAAFEQQQRQLKAQQDEDAYVQRVAEVGQRFEKVAVGALQRAKVPPEAAPMFLERIAEHLDRNERLGLELDEGEVADLVMKEQETAATGWMKAKAPPDLADILEASGLAKPLMEEFARRVRSKFSNGTPAPVYGSTTSTATRTQERELTAAEKMDRLRTFGGGSPF